MTLNEVYAVLSHCDPGAVQIIISRHPEPQVALCILIFNKTHNDKLRLRKRGSVNLQTG